MQMHVLLCGVSYPHPETTVSMQVVSNYWTRASVWQCTFLCHHKAGLYLLVRESARACQMRVYSVDLQLMV